MSHSLANARPQVARRRRLPHVAFVTTQYEEAHNGPGTFSKYLQEAQRRGQVNLTFVSEDMQAAAAPHERRVTLPAWSRRPIQQFVRQHRYYEAFRGVHRKQPVDVLWFNTAKNGLEAALRSRDVPTVLMVNDYSNAESRNPWASRQAHGLSRAVRRAIWHWIEYAAVRACMAVVVNSEHMRRRIAQAYHVPEDKLYLLHKAVDPVRFRYEAPVEITEPVRVFFLKDDYRRGGLRELLAALREVPFATELTIAGPKLRTHDHVRSLIAASEYSGRVHLNGRIAREHVVQLFRTHDVLCVPSHSEAFGVVFLEALASGMPAIGPRVGGVPEVLDQGRAGWLVEPRNPAGVASALQEIVQKRERRMEKATHGRRHVQRFSVEAAVARFNEITRAVRRKHI